MTLATIDRQGRPAARMVVVREFERDTLTLTTDCRAEKWSQVGRTSNATGVVWLADQRMQFRLRGLGRHVGDEDTRRRIWAGLTDASRAMFHWPMPGEAFVSDGAEGRFARAVGQDSPLPEVFGVISLDVDEADVLDLRPHPHVRMTWRREAASTTAPWVGRRVNP